MAKAPPHAPWLPTDYTVADASAIHALARGTADADQQRRAFDWIKRCAGWGDISFRPDDLGGERGTSFAEGKRFVAAQIVKLATIDLAALRKRHGRQPGQPTEQGT